MAMRNVAFDFYARAALSAAFLSACADRLGLWGAAETPGVDWGSMSKFIGATAALAPYMPEVLLPATAWIVTILEIALGIALIAGFQLKFTCLVSGVLLAIFAVSMVIFLGPKFPLNYSVFTASACSFLLYRQASTSRPSPASVSEKDDG